MEIEFAITAISFDTKRPILLCIDELMKSPNPQQLSTAIGNTISIWNSNKLNVVMSTLDWEPIHKGTNCRRSIISIPLKQLSFEESMSLFKNKEIEDNIKRAIVYCNGHPSSLASLSMYLKDTQKLPKNTQIN